MSLKDVRVKGGADAACDHQLLLGTFKVKLRAHHDSSAKPHCKNNILNLKCNKAAKLFNCTVKSKVFPLEFRDEDLNINWAGLKKTKQETCDKVLGRGLNSPKEWLSKETLVFDNAEERS